MVSKVPPLVAKYPFLAVQTLFPDAKAVRVSCPASEFAARTVENGCTVFEERPCLQAGNVLNIIMHLNDNHKWSRAHIADWLDTVGEFPLSATTVEVERAISEKPSVILDAMFKSLLVSGPHRHLWSCVSTEAGSNVTFSVRFFHESAETHNWSVSFFLANQDHARDVVQGMLESALLRAGVHPSDPVWRYSLTMPPSEKSLYLACNPQPYLTQPTYKEIPPPWHANSLPSNASPVWPPFPKLTP